jgi:hypothetical protein
LFFAYEMLMEIGVDELDLVALLMGPRLAMGISIHEADGVGTGVSSLWHFSK